MLVRKRESKTRKGRKAGRLEPLRELPLSQLEHIRLGRSRVGVDHASASSQPKGEGAGVLATGALCFCV